MKIKVHINLQNLLIPAQPKRNTITLTDILEMNKGWYITQKLVKTI